MKKLLLSLSLLCLMACSTMDEEISKSNRIEYWISEHKFVVAEGEANAQTTDSLVSVQVHAIAIDGQDTIEININEAYPVDSIVTIPDSSSAKLMCPWGKYTHYMSGDCSIFKSDYTAQVDQIRLSVSCKTKESYGFIVYGTLLH